jgi:hypothetical protein
MATMNSPRTLPTATLTAEDVARILGTSVGGLAQLRFRGEGPAYLKFGRAVRYLDSDVEAYITAARVQTRMPA